MSTDRILLGQLGANGDCLYATILARQLRHDYPRANIVWAISSQCASLLKNNPDVDEIWEIPVAGWDQHEIMWKVFEREALRRYQRRDFDQVLFSQIWPEHFERYDGTVRPSILRSYGRPITVPIENVIRLTDGEIDAVDRFVKESCLLDYEHRILFECSAKSGQSFITPDVAQDIADQLYQILPSVTVLFSTHLPMVLRDSRSRYAGSLSLRESARLTHFCSLFVGAGSGGTVAASSTAARPLPMMQLLSASSSVFASFAHDFEYFGIADRPVIEMTNENPHVIAKCIAAVCRHGIVSAKQQFGGKLSVQFSHYFNQINLCLLRRHRYLDAACSLMTTAERYGWTKDLIRFGEIEIAPRLEVDPSWLFAHNRRTGETLRAALADAARNPAEAPHQKRTALP